MTSYEVYWAEFHATWLGKPDFTCRARGPRHALGQFFESWGSPAKTRAFGEQTDMGMEYYAPKFDRATILVRKAATFGRNARRG